MKVVPVYIALLYTVAYAVEQLCVTSMAREGSL
jgi:hypothetical protein